MTIGDQNLLYLSQNEHVLAENANIKTAKQALNSIVREWILLLR